VPWLIDAVLAEPRTTPSHVVGARLGLHAEPVERIRADVDAQAKDVPPAA
jgi:hypothetical protein